MGNLVDRVHRDLSGEDILRISSTYHSWRGEKDSGKYKDISGFCKNVTTEEIVTRGHILTPGRYVGAEEIEDDDEPFEERFRHLAAKLSEQFLESANLERKIKKNLQGLLNDN